MQISVAAQVAAVRAELSLLQRQQLPFAVAQSLTYTARDVQLEVRREMRGQFTIRREWVIQGIRIKSATKADWTAAVFSRDPFMALHETGGPNVSLHKRVFDYGDYLAVPLDARRTKLDIVKRDDWPQNLIRPFILTARDGRQYLAVRYVRNGSKGERSVRALRKGRTESGVKLMYRLVKRTELRKRLTLIETGRRLVPERFPVHLERNLVAALAGAR